MPKDSKGNFHLNTQRANAADRAGAKPAPTVSEKDRPGAVAAKGAGSSTLHDHGDGTFHSEGKDGEQVEHPSIGHALMHLAAKHSDGKHMHVHSSAGHHTSHHVGEGGDVEGPNEHDSDEELKDHVGEVMGDEMPDADSDRYGDLDDSERDRSLSGLTA